MQLPTLSADAPLVIVFNRVSGSRDAQASRDAMQAVLDEAKRPHEFIVVEGGSDLPAIARHAAALALARRGAVVAVGGDGTVNAVAQAAHDSGCAIGVVPCGTFNYFGRTHGLPTDPADATRALLTAPVQPIQVGLVNDRVFLVNASLGLYPQLLEDRESFKAQFGRSRFVALLSALFTLLREHRQLRLRIEHGDRTRVVRTPTLFVGNNRLQLEQVGIAQAPALDEGHIAAVMLRPVGTLALLGLLLRGAMGALGEAERVESFVFRRIVVQPRLPYGRRGVKVATDGEVTRLRTPLEFRVSPKPLYLLKPLPASSAE